MEIGQDDIQQPSTAEQSPEPNEISIENEADESNEIEMEHEIPWREYKTKSRAVKRIDSILARLPTASRTVVIDKVTSSDSDSNSNNFEHVICDSMINFNRKIH